MSEMRILNGSGDEVVTWEPDIEEQKANAQKQFEALVKDGYTAYRSDDQEIIADFDPDAERIILFGPVAGG